MDKYTNRECCGGIIKDKGYVMRQCCIFGNVRGLEHYYKLLGKFQPNCFLSCASVYVDFFGYGSSRSIYEGKIKCIDYLLEKGEVLKPKETRDILDMGNEMIMEYLISSVR